MSIIGRRIVGPQQQFERTGAQSLRDIRPLTARLSEGLRSSASGLVLGVAAVGTFFEPAVVDLTVPASMLYALWVLTRRVELPMRLPRSAARPDYGNPTPGSRKPKLAGGCLFIGWDTAGKELWATAEDARQHITIPGTTGSGKTTAILSLLANALAQGSGFVLVDGKGDRDLFGKVLALARRFGREDDVRALNFMVASGLKQSHTWNAFATGNADAIPNCWRASSASRRPMTRTACSASARWRLWPRLSRCWSGCATTRASRSTSRSSASRSSCAGSGGWRWKSALRCATRRPAPRP